MSPATDPPRAIAVLLGASAFPHEPALEDSPAFAASARAFREYLTSGEGFVLPTERLLDLFDSGESVIEQNRRLVEFLKAHSDASDLIFYYVGHGGFLRNREYFLALRSTEERAEWLTALRIGALAHTLEEWCHDQRKYLLLDCCFAGEAVREFQSSELPTLVESETFQALPQTGTSLLVAASKDQPAIAPTGHERTMFSKCLLEVLTEGLPDGIERLSLAQLGTATERRIRSEFGLRAVRPEVHSPRQERGDLARLPLFPNRAWRPPPPVVLPEEVIDLLASPRVSLRKAAVEELGHLAKGGDPKLSELAIAELHRIAESDDSLSVRALAERPVERREPDAPRVSPPPAGAPEVGRQPAEGAPGESELGFTEAEPPPGQLHQNVEAGRSEGPSRPGNGSQALGEVAAQSSVEQEETAGPVGRAPSGEMNLRQLARAHRRLMVWFATVMGIGVLQLLWPGLQSEPSSAATKFVVGSLALAGIGATVRLAHATYLTAQALGNSRGQALAWAVATLLPCVNVGVVFYLSHYAVQRCRASGIPVGFMGPKVPN